MNARLFCTCTGALNRPRAGEAGALILRAEEPGAGDAAGILGSGLDLQRPSYIGEDWDGSLQS